MNLLHALLPDPAALAAHDRQAAALTRDTRVAPDMLDALDEPLPYRPDYEGQVLAVCGPVPLSMTEIAARAKLGGPQVRHCVARLSHRKKLRNVSAIGLPGRYVIAGASLNAAPRGAFDR